MRKKLLEFVNSFLALFGVRLIRSDWYRTARSIPLDERANVSLLREHIDTPIHLAVLGSIGEDFSLPGNLADKIRLFSLDALSPGNSKSDNNVVQIHNVISDVSGDCRFIERESAGVSSLLEPDSGLIAEYGLDKEYTQKKEHRVSAITLKELADQHHVPHWDYLRTDLEGLDFAVVASLGDDIRHASLVEMELRFEPFYEGEPFLHEVVAYMFDKGFEVLDIKTERWRALTPNVIWCTRGRAVFANVVFVKRDIEQFSLGQIVRQIIVLGLMGYANFAERVIARLATDYPEIAHQAENLLFNSAKEPYHPFKKGLHVTHGTNDGYY